MLVMTGYPVTTESSSGDDADELNQEQEIMFVKTLLQNDTDTQVTFFNNC